MAFKFHNHVILIFAFCNKLLLLVLAIVLVSCKSDSTPQHTSTDITLADTTVENTLIDIIQNIKAQQIIDYDSTLWTEILPSPTLTLDLKYATEDNFTDQKIYDCGRCFLRPHVARAFNKFSKYLKDTHNLGIILYDCYRPRPYQQKLWDIVPDWRYVTPPDKGSMHNRGMAIDIGLIDSLGHVMDMGTSFDHFGEESFHSAQNISPLAIQNRKLLKAELEKFGFKSITSEWWHYSYRENVMPLSDWVWNCEE